MREVVDVHYKIIVFNDKYHKVYLPTSDDEKRTWVKWNGPNWVPVEDQEEIDKLNLAYNNLLYDQEQNQ